MKKILFIFLLSHMMLWSQQENNVLISKNTFSVRDGYLIANPYSAMYDASGWLWVLGENKMSNEYVIGDKEVIIQRFDGANFFTLKLPKILNKKIEGGHFFKHKDHGLYLRIFHYTERDELFFIDTETLEIKRVEEYNNLNLKFLRSQEYYIDNSTRLILTTNHKFYNAELNGVSLKFIDSISFDKPNIYPFTSPVITTPEFQMVKVTNEKDGIFLDKNGKIIRKISKNDFIDTKGNHFYPNTIHNIFKEKDRFYYNFDDYKNLFTYNTINKKFTEIPNTNSNLEKNKELGYTNDYKNAVFLNPIGSHTELELYTFNDFKPKLITSVPIKNFSMIIFKGFHKDLIVLNGNTLESYFFVQGKINTFLKEKSIRTIKKIKDHTYLVATDAEGIYLIDTKNNTEKKVKIKLDNNEVPINYSRDIFLEKDGTIIINDNDILYTLDSSYNVLKDKTVRIYGEEVIRIKDTIYNANKRGSIFKYSINEKKNTQIQNTDTLNVKELATDTKILYATTNKGLFEYENGVFKIYEFENEATENLLSITYLKNYGVLVSTKFGKIYTFDTKNKKLNLIYKDEVNASIVGVIADNNNNLWFNTYAGIVYFNPTTKRVIRYTVKDGVYELEGNRFSTYKDDDGNIFMGSYKGLSFFNPAELIEINKEVQPQFTSISFFDETENKWKINSSPSFLKNIKKIILPAEYRRFSVTMSIFGEINPEEITYKYRLKEQENNSDWLTTANGKEILFANLASGKYTLQVEVLNASKKKLGETIELMVISENIFYKTWWFILVLILGFLAIIIFVFYQYKVRQKLATKNEIALNEAKIKSVMMLEIHHRIKNNLQIVSGLLGLQMLNSTNNELKEKLQDSQSRVESIASIHNILYSSNNQNNILVKSNVENIIKYYRTLYPIKVNYILIIDDSILDLDKATPFTLLLNELVNNSNKHAFAKVDKPEIYINFAKKGKRYVFEYADNGSFKKTDTYNKESMGMRIVGMMNTQLEGTLKIEDGSGFKLTVLF